jgi:glyoxylate reductase
MSGIKVSNTPGAVDEATATTAVYLLLATMRRFSECEARLRAGSFPPPKHIEADARDLSGKTIGILGMGGIGTTFVNFIRPFGMRMLYHNRRKNASAPQDVQYISNLYDMLRQVDVLVVSIPLNDATRGYMGEKEIRSMKKGSIIVNTARGPIIDEEAMIRALQDGHVSGIHCSDHSRLTAIAGISGARCIHQRTPG